MQNESEIARLARAESVHAITIALPAPARMRKNKLNFISDYIDGEVDGRGRPRFNGGLLYFLQAGEGGPIKIGWTRYPERRFAELQTSCPFELKVLLCVATCPSLERDFQWDMRRSWIRGEWFRPTKQVLSLIAALRPYRHFTAEEKNALLDKLQ